MILDEIQCGMGRTGKMFAYDQYGVLPDVVTVAKAIGCGVPLGGFMVRGKARDVLVAGDHGSTYGGNPLATAACNAVLDQYEELDLLNHVEKVGSYMYDKLEELKNSKSCIKDHRGMGLIQGIELSEDVPAGDVVKKAMDKGLILITAAKNVIRFLPPLIITEADVDSMIDIIKDCL